MNAGDVSLGDLMIAIAAFELVAVVLMARSLPGSRPDATPDQVRGRNYVVGAGIAAAIGLALMGLFWPLAQDMRIL
ncbi:MAG TPA: hypothetical protein VFQ67_11705 [Allosphingosinicella sp.]|jgi:hypothetical protein|nr:hypothetical protein [Allosphingosinicella sp.]